MKRAPIHYSRLLVFAGLVPLLLAELVAGLPDGVFVVVGIVVVVTAAAVHFYGGEPNAGAGWLVFGAALALVEAVGPTATPAYLGAFGLLLAGGIALLASQRFVGDA